MILMAVDEYKHKSVSNMIDRIRNLKGDPRYYLAEVKIQKKTSSKSSDGEHVGFIHRLPYMKMDKKLHRRVNLILFSFLVLGVIDPL